MVDKDQTFTEKVLVIAFIKYCSWQLLLQFGCNDNLKSSLTYNGQIEKKIYLLLCHCRYFDKYFFPEMCLEKSPASDLLRNYVANTAENLRTEFWSRPL